MSASSAVVFYLFRLYDGRRMIMDSDGKSLPAYYVLYNTSLTCADDPRDNGIDAELRLYFPQGTLLYPDGTVIYASTKVFAAANQTVVLDAVHHNPFPDDPARHIPRNVESSVVLHGSVKRGRTGKGVAT
jgi:hypothetical protein